MAATGQTNWQYLKKRLRDSWEFKWRQDTMIAVFAATIGYFVLGRQAARDFVSVLEIGLAATILFEAVKTGYRFMWTVPRRAHIKLEQALDRLSPKFKVEQIVPQRTDTNAQGTVAMYLQVIPECLSDASVEECQGWLLLVSRSGPNGE